MRSGHRQRIPQEARVFGSANGRKEGHAAGHDAVSRSGGAKNVSEITLIDGCRAHMLCAVKVLLTSLRSMDIVPRYRVIRSVPSLELREARVDRLVVDDALRRHQCIPN